MLDEKAGGLDRNRGGAEKLRRYWTTGPGGAKIGWGAPGDWTRCVSQLSKYLGPRAKGYCALRHKEMNGMWPGDQRNKSDSNDDIDTNSIYHESKQNLGDIGEPMLEHKTVGVKGMNVVSADEGIVETIISVTGVVDNVKDRIMPGAYQKTLAKRKPKGVWSHDWDTPVSKTLEVRELMPGDKELPKLMPNGDPWPSGAGALKVKTQFNLETQRGREAYSDVVFFGEEQEWSIGYNVPVGGAKVDSKSGVREITMLELYEYSPVLFGAMPLARTTSVKEAQMALKALKGGAAAWLSEAADEDEDVEEYAPVMEEDDEDETEEKAYDLSGDQMILVKTAIQTLSDLLDAVQSETKKFPTPPDDEVEDDEDAMANPMADDDDDYVVMGDEDMSEEDSEMPEEDMYDSLADAIDDLIDDETLRDELIVIADEIDSAMEQEDRDYFESASKAFLDKIEENLGADDEEDLRELAEIIADMIEQMGGEEEADEEMESDEEFPSEDTMDVPEEEIEEDVEKKRAFSAEQREEMAGEGTAMPDGSFPIANEADLRNAIQAHGRAKDIEKAKAHIKKRARALGLTDLIPSEWNEGKAVIDITEIKSLLDDLKS